MHDGVFDGVIDMEWLCDDKPPVTHGFPYESVRNSGLV